MSEKRKRNEQGKYVSTITSERVLQVLEEGDDPVVTAKEVAEELDCSSEAARQQLRSLENKGEVKSKQVGARAVVWWKSR